MSIHSIDRDPKTGRFMALNNGVDGNHETSIEAPSRTPVRTPRDLTKTVIPTMSVIVLCATIFGIGLAIGRYKESTDNRFQTIELQLKGIKGDMDEVKKLLRRRTARI